VAQESHMRNDDLTKLARWIVPGWLTFLTFLGFIVMDILVTMPGDKTLFSQATLEYLKSLFSPDNISSSQTLLTVVVGVAAGVPVGFVVYQLYFFLRWNSPFSRDGLLSLIPGRRKDLQKSVQYLKNELALRKKWRSEIINHPLYKTDHSFQYRYIESFFIEACQFLDKGTDVSVFSRHRYLHEVVHTLGASIGGVYVGFFGYLLLRLRTEDLNASIYLPIVFIIVIAFFVLMNAEDEKRYKYNTNIRLREEDQDNESPVSQIDLPKLKIGFAFPSSQFLFTLTIFHFFGNPRFSPPTFSGINTFYMFFSSTLGLRLMLVLLILGLWTALTHRNANTRIKVGGAIWATLSTAGALILAAIPDKFSWVDWPFFLNFVIFLIANLILFSNRRNASDDMLFLEYNTIQRYLDVKNRSRK
jgi:hypothetical protein